MRRRDRAEARRVWSVRMRLSLAGQRLFDDHSPVAMRMVSELLTGVLTQPDRWEDDPGLTPYLEPGTTEDEIGRRSAPGRIANP